jgi:hypothetical protein
MPVPVASDGGVSCELRYKNNSDAILDKLAVTAIILPNLQAFVSVNPNIPGVKSGWNVPLLDSVDVPPYSVVDEELDKGFDLMVPSNAKTAYLNLLISSQNSRVIRYFTVLSFVRLLAGC